ncbi:anhydro-N-acetylmuramic acid kinase [Parvularcula sp. IMCC14364]|uniref:anhydro-N-acetylmuramic acid kinase n=1 Tax=Parvularcula sp. IMCC14364 TaxID=3067902 RepID=UPI0027424B10|nr:anhydro-N-acetylmuramic acid kinase [Parvularcula sp. IMCC14364]
MLPSAPNTQSQPLTAIGLMSGTSLDGVDVALLRSDGEDVIEAGPTLSVPYPRMTKVWVQRAIKAALEGRSEANEIANAIDEVTSAHIRAVQKFMEKHHLVRKEIDVIGFHGQTILHRPPIDRSAPGRTWQIGSGQIMAEELGINVVDGFRLNDMAQGGEGAPFAPVYHAVLVRKLDRKHPVCVLNIGGVANVTWIPTDGDPMKMVAFDCGPGNGLVDQWVDFQTGERMDKDGAYAAAGEVQDEVLRLMLLNPYLRRKPPKSLDRYDFKIDHIKEMSTQDGAATLTAFTAACIERSVSLLPAAPGEWIVVGGGGHNPVLMAEIRDRLAAPVMLASDAGWRGDFLEAECFAYLAVRSLRKLPLSYPGTTRINRPLTGGMLHTKPV